MKSHKDLKVWKDAMAHVTSIYNNTKYFPEDEKFGLTSQIRRCAVSIPSNIAEGSARNTDKDFMRFLYISLGSAAELHTQLIIANNLKFLKDEEFKVLLKDTDAISKMLSGLIKSIKRKNSD